MTFMDRSHCQDRLRKSHRVVIKIGSSLLTDPDSSDGIQLPMIQRLRDEIGFLYNHGVQVMLVTSGAVAMGREIIKRPVGPAFNQGFSTGFDSLTRKQALSAIGQGRLMSVYREVMAESAIPVAQLLITARDFRDRHAYLNIGHTIQELTRLKVLPIINENDTVSTEELRFGDNDLLAAACASLFHADLLIILTTAEGFLTNGQRVPFLRSIGEEEMSHAGGPQGPGSGGMRTKLRAAQLCAMTGEITAILPGNTKSPVQDLFQGKDIGTLVCGHRNRNLSARKKWLLFSRPRGSVIIDKGARVALQERGSSLLIGGVVAFHGKFLADDIVEIEEIPGKSIGRGIIRYSHRELQPIIARKKSAASSNGETQRLTEVIHRNDMILEI